MLNKELVAQVTETLEARGTNLATYVQLHLRAFSRSKAILGLSDKMSFGKYFGEVVENIVRADPGYIVYCIGLNGSTKFGVDVMELLEALEPDEVTDKDPDEQIPY